MVSASIALGLVLVQAADKPLPCAQIETNLRRELSVTAMQMEPEASRLRIRRDSVEASRGCPDSDEIAYLGLRARELVPGDADPDLAFRKYIQEVAARFSCSVKIATVRARQEKTVDAARRAVAIDPAYAPAQVALARALLAANDAAGAAAAIGGVKDLCHLDDGYAVLARVKWARGDVAGAIDAAQKEISGGRRSPTIEPVSQSAIPMAEAHEVLGLAYLEQNQPDRAVPHLREAAWASPKVKELLR